MRATLVAAVPLLAVLGALPAQGQVSARLHVDIPIGRRPPVVAAPARRQLVVRDYDLRRYGSWESYYDEWTPETVYLYNGYYYDYPIVAYAQPIVVYRYRNELFFAPRQREFIQWRERRDYRNGRDYRPAPWNGRDNRGSPAPRGGRDNRPGSNNGHDGRDGRDGGNGHGNNGHDGNVGRGGSVGHGAPPARGGARGRPRGNH